MNERAVIDREAKQRLAAIKSANLVRISMERTMKTKGNKTPIKKWAETEQGKLDKKRRSHAEEIIKGTPRNKIYEVAIKWVVTANQHACNEAYWRDRAERAETVLITYEAADDLRDAWTLKMSRSTSP